MTSDYYAQPIARRDDGAVLTDNAVECRDAESAIRCAEKLARSPGYIGAWAFSWSDRDGGPLPLKRFGML